MSVLAVILGYGHGWKGGWVWGMMYLADVHGGFVGSVYMYYSGCIVYVSMSESRRKTKRKKGRDTGSE